VLHARSFYTLGCGHLAHRSGVFSLFDEVHYADLMNIRQGVQLWADCPDDHRAGGSPITLPVQPTAPPLPQWDGQSDSPGPQSGTLLLMTVLNRARSSYSSRNLEIGPTWGKKVHGRFMQCKPIQVAPE
jgi:hypothetical protein